MEILSLEVRLIVPLGKRRSARLSASIGRTRAHYSALAHDLAKLDLKSMLLNYSAKMGETGKYPCFCL